MATFDNQEDWVPYERSKDCSQGFCSIYCPQWCYTFFPPPPPFSIDGDDDDKSSAAFSPLVIAVIGILAGAFLLVSYYTIVSKYCGSISLQRRLRRTNLEGSTEEEEEEEEEESGSQSRRHESWHVSPSNGLDEALIGKITVYRYKRGEGLVDGTDCSVCLGEFREDDSLRLLPKCSHAFHLRCIDTWLKSHSNCPLCRATIFLPVPVTQTQFPVPAMMEQDSRSRDPPSSVHEYNLVVAIEDIEQRGGTEEEDLEEEVIGDEEDIQPVRRSLSMGSSYRGRVSIADVLQMSMEDQFVAASAASSFRRSRGEQGDARRGRSRGLHCVMSPVRMKRSVSSGRSCLVRRGRGANSLLPL